MSEAAKLTVTSDSADYKTISGARRAFHAGDVEASRREHKKVMHHKESHNSGASEYIKSIVFGGLDGIATTFAIVAAAAGSNGSYATVLIFGISNVIADGFSMGFGEYVSGNAELDNAISERAREEWEVENAFDLEVDEMVQVYEMKGLTHDEATAIVQIISRDKKRFVDFMMVEELGILVDIDDQYGPMKQGLVMFFSFLIFGTIPLLAYATGRGSGLDVVFGVSCFLTTLSLIILGAVKGYLTGMSVVRSAVLMALNGGICGLVSYGVSAVIEGYLRTEVGSE